jgi:excisionase family DNA binding protein
MEQEDSIRKLLREMLEPIIDDCITRALNKYINELRFDTPITDNVLGVIEVATYLKISKATVYKLTMDQQLPHYKQGKRLYFRKEEIDNWINKGKVKTKQEINEEAESYLSRRGRRT